MNYRDGSIVLDLHQEVLEPIMRGEHRAAVLESVACNEDVIRHVADQILDGWTENGNCGMTHVAADPQCALSQARRSIALGANEVAAREIRELTQRVASLDAENARLIEALRDARRDR